MFDLAALNLAPLLFHLNPGQMPQCLRGPLNGPIDGVRVAYLRGAGNFGDAVGLISHVLLFQKIAEVRTRYGKLGRVRSQTLV